MRLILDAAGEPRVRMLLDVTNPNPFAITLRSVEARLSIADVAVASVSLTEPVILPPSGSAHVEAEARPDFAALRQAIERVLRRLVAAYEVAGMAVVQDGIRLEFRKRGDLPLADLLGRIR